MVFGKMKNFYQPILFAVIVFLLGCFTFRYYKDIEIVNYKKRLNRHGQLDRLVKADCLFVKKQKQSNVSFFKNNLAHLRDLDDKFRKLIFRHKELEKTMTYEWAAVREQGMLLEQADLKEDDQFTVLETCEQLSKCVTRICELVDEQQSILLYWENVKNERIKQKETLLKKLNNIAIVDNYMSECLCNDNTGKTDKIL